MATEQQLMRDLAHMGGSDHTATQMDSFILVSNGFTVYGQYRQALRQLHSLISGVKSLERKMRRRELDSKECVHKLGEDRFEHDFDRERCSIDKEEAEWEIALIGEKLSSKCREMQHFADAASRLRDELGENMSDPARQLAAEQDHWVQLYKRDAALSIQVNGNVHLGLLRDIVSLPVQMRSKIMTAIQKPAELQSWLGQRDPTTVAEEPRRKRRTLGDGARANS